ncbi:hypothetical protein M1N41_02115 [Thermodesulfovibrionales bacterium]|nr:hypothetical protein [Thermodesulfovibrionales bacterium]
MFPWPVLRVMVGVEPVSSIIGAHRGVTSAFIIAQGQAALLSFGCGRRPRYEV